MDTELPKAKPSGLPRRNPVCNGCNFFAKKRHCKNGIDTVTKKRHCGFKNVSRYKKSNEV